MQNEIRDLGELDSDDNPIAETTTEYLYTEISSDNINNENVIQTQLKKLKGFGIGHKNIMSLTKCIDQLRFYLHHESLDTLSVN